MNKFYRAFRKFTSTLLFIGVCSFGGQALGIEGEKSAHAASNSPAPQRPIAKTAGPKQNGSPKTKEIPKTDAGSVVDTKTVPASPETGTEPPPPPRKPKLHLKKAQVARNINGLLGIGTENSAACIRRGRGDRAMAYMTIAIKKTKTWIGRWDSVNELVECIKRIPPNTTNFVIGGHGYADTVPPLFRNNYRKVAAAIKAKGTIKHVGFSACLVGRNAGRENYNSLPKLLARDSGADVTSFNQVLYASPNAMSANQGTVGYTWMSGISDRNADFVGAQMKKPRFAKVRKSIAMDDDLKGAIPICQP